MTEVRHVFILNPVAGKNHSALLLEDKIKQYFAQNSDEEYSIRITDGKGAATRIAEAECAAGDAVRLYACGGDGTLQETANGIPEGSNAELTVIPCGSGNDYVRIFGGKEWFLDLPDLIRGEAVPVDAVECGGMRSLNIASIGMDAAVCARMNKYKNLPGVSGSLAYELAIVDTFVHPIGDEMDITVTDRDGSEEHRHGNFLLALAANGQYYGGGYHGAPQAVEDDGVLDFVLVKKIPRLRIPGFLKKYKAGDYADLPYCEHLRGTAMTVSAAHPTWCNVDGECTCSARMSFSIIPHAFRFVLPAAVAAARRAAREIIGGPAIAAAL